MPDAPHVLVIRRRYLGDIVLLGSVFRNLRLHWPDAHLTALTEAPYAGVAAAEPRRQTRRSPSAPPRRVAGLPARAAPRALHACPRLRQYGKTAVLTRVTGALLRVAFDRELIKFRYRRCYTHSAKVTNAFYDSHHITEPTCNSSNHRRPIASTKSVSCRAPTISPRPSA